MHPAVCIPWTEAMPMPVVLPATIEATRVAAGLPQPVFATAAPGDPARLFVVEKAGHIERRWCINLIRIERY